MENAISLSKRGIWDTPGHEREREIETDRKEEFEEVKHR
jgi:hypothetical protein